GWWIRGRATCKRKPHMRDEFRVSRFGFLNSKSKIKNQRSLRSLRLVVRRGLGALVAQDGFAAEANLVAFDGDHLDQKLVAFLEVVPDVRDAVFGHFADVLSAVV